MLGGAARTHCPGRMSYYRSAPTTCSAALSAATPDRPRRKSGHAPWIRSRRLRSCAPRVLSSSVLARHRCRLPRSLQGRVTAPRRLRSAPSDRQRRQFRSCRRRGSPAAPTTPPAPRGLRVAFSMSGFGARTPSELPMRTRRAFMVAPHEPTMHLPTRPREGEHRCAPRDAFVTRPE
jgi:hypothetical protein